MNKIFLTGFVKKDGSTSILPLDIKFMFISLHDVFGAGSTLINKGSLRTVVRGMSVSLCTNTLENRWVQTCHRRENARGLPVSLGLANEESAVILLYSNL